VTAEHGDVAQFRSTPLPHRRQARHPGAGENIRDGIARLSESRDERPDRRYRNFGQIAVAVVRRASSILRHPAWEFTELLPLFLRRESAC
jgi:hypothetical protein